MKLSKEARRMSRELFRVSFTDSKLDQSKVRTIVQEIAEAKPRHYLDILKDYQRLIRLEVEKRHAVIESAIELDEVTRGQLEQTLRAKYGSDLTTEFKATPELIAGLRIRIGSDVWDSSVRERLNRLESQLATV
ncbi:F0F1 ATP synthase subunit delta [Verrucomicrobiota bacterium sgz303538]